VVSRSDHSPPRHRLCVAASLGIVLALATPDVFAATHTSASTGGLRSYVDIDGEVAASSGELASATSSSALGYQVDFGIGPRALPLLFGIDLGVISLGELRSDVVTDAPWLDRAEVRHGELSLRLEPDFRFVRPFIEASAGVALLYFTPSSGSEDDDVLADTAFSRGVSLGLDLSPWDRRGPVSGGASVVLTLGYRLWESGPLYTSQPAFGDVTSGGPLRIQGPFIGLTVFGWS
jgi:hypothetical protein